jgi:hypothetical protein
MTMRDLARLGITSDEQLDAPFPEGIIIKAKVVLKRTDDGDEYNQVKWFDFVTIEKPEPSPFTPSDDGEPAEPDRRDSDGYNWGTGEQETPPTSSREQGGHSQP